MTENVRRILDAETPGTRMVLWAHNGHVCRGNVFGEVPAMGYHLHRAYGDAYYARGFAFDRGYFAARRASWLRGAGALAEHTVGPAPEGTVDWQLARPGLGDYLVDLRRAPEDGAVARWLAETRPMRSVGAGTSCWSKHVSYARTKLSSQYDGLAFFGETTRARPNATAKTGAAEDQTNSSGLHAPSRPFSPTTTRWPRVRISPHPPHEKISGRPSPYQRLCRPINTARSPQRPSGHASTSLSPVRTPPVRIPLLMPRSVAARRPAFTVNRPEVDSPCA